MSNTVGTNSVGNLWDEKDIKRQVLPELPSPTVVHLMERRGLKFIEKPLKLDSLQYNKKKLMYKNFILVCILNFKQDPEKQASEFDFLPPVSNVWSW